MTPNRPPTCPNSAVVPQVLIYFRFVLVPLTLAYFFTFLLSPVQNLFEYRCGTPPQTATDDHSMIMCCDNT